MNHVTEKPWLHVVVVLIFSGLLLFVYRQSVEVDTADLYRVTSLTEAIALQDNKLESDLSLLFVGELKHFDSLNQGLQRMDDLMRQVTRELSDTPMMQPYVASLRQAIAKQKTPIEHFKRQLSIYLSSMRYLPVLMEQVQQQFPQYIPLLQQVYHEILHMVVQRDAFDDSKLQATLAAMQEPELQPVARHIQLILKQYAGVRESMYAFLHCGIEEAVDALETQYEQWFSQKLNTANHYRELLLWFSLLLLAYVIVVLWHLWRSHHALKERNLFLHFLQKSLDEHAVVTISDTDGNITFVNDKFCQSSGYSKEEVLGKNHRILKSGEHPPSFYEDLWHTITHGKTWHGVMKNKRKDGSFYWVDTTITPFLDKDGKAWQYVAVRTDMTKQMEAEQRLKESHERYRILSELTPFALGIVQNGVWIYVNPAAINMFAAQTSQDLVGQPFYSFVAEESQEHLLGEIRLSCRARKPVPLQEVVLTTCQGQSFDAELQGAPVYWDDEAAMLLVMHDITERKQMEKERALYQERLEHKQRLESLGVLAGGIAHDFNNILTAILGNTALASQKVQGCSDALSYLDKVNRASERAAELCQQLLMYSGGGKMEKKAVLLSELLDDVIEMVATTIQDNIQLNIKVAEHLPLVEGDVRQLQQVILNLLTNAKEAIEGAGTITVELGVRHVDKHCTWISEQEVPDGEYVYLHVVDTGCGMDEETQHKIFEPFFTTKISGRGLGMSAILGIVHAHQGALSLTSQVGQGTSICVVLPVAHHLARPETHEKETINEPLTKGMALVIDDEPAILELAAFVLDEAGFDVVTAEDGEQGLKQFEAHKDALSVVICDMVMPKLGGAEVANHIHQKRPDLPILLASGYDRNTLSKIDYGVIHTVIQKPYIPEDLVQEVFKALRNS